MTLLRKCFVGAVSAALLLPLLANPASAREGTKTQAARILQELKNPSGKVVLVIAHRADWRHYPENSLEAIKGAAQIGVDVVEIDVKKSKDGVFVLMHDKELKRTSNGQGNITEKTIEELVQLRLKDHKGNLTDCKIPRLRDAFLAAKDRILVNLDHVPINDMEDIYRMAVELGVEKQIIIKSGSRYEKMVPVMEKMPNVLFMPIISLDKKGSKEKFDEYERELTPFAYEIIPTKEPSEEFEFVQKTLQGKRHLWINTLWDSLCLGHSDEKAMKDPDKNWGWALRCGATMIQTDRPTELIQYLKSLDRRWTE